MSVRKLIIREAVRYCQEKGGCSEAELAYVFGLSPSSAYHLFKILKELCHSGFLNTGDLKCEVVGNKIVLSKVGDNK